MSELQSDTHRLSTHTYNAILEDWRAMLRVPYPEVADMLLKLTNGRAARHATKADVESFLRAMYRLTPRRISNETFVVTVDQEGGHKDKKVRSATFGGDLVELKSDSWDDLLIAVCTKIARENPDEFKRVLEQITSLRGRRYFAGQPDTLSRWEKIPGTSIYVEQNLAANNVVSLCNKLADLFGYFPRTEVEMC